MGSKAHATPKTSFALRLLSKEQSLKGNEGQKVNSEERLV
jgi:hypothetical protein